MNLRDFSSPDHRRIALEEKLDVSLSSIGSSALPSSPASEKNCENMIGYTQVPIGVAGPLKIQNSRHSGKRVERARPESDSGVVSPSGTPQNDDIREYFIPLATTEGALVASISRGCKAIAEAGGAVVDSYKVGMSRGPVFYTGTIREGNKLFDFIKHHESDIKNHAESTSNHVTLKKITVKSLTNYTFLRFVYDTQDAMGMNMTTIATQKAVEFIEKETGIACLSVAGNFDSDKKPSWITSIEHRGIKVWAEVVIPKQVVEKVLKTSPAKFFDLWLGKIMLGSAVSGSIGFNAHIANVISAIFIATGQDPAHVVEGSLGITTAKVLENGDLYVGVYLPSLLVGTVGGGTNLPTQKEALSILGVSGAGNVEEFAQIVVAACLAGEISLLASLSEGSLAKAHERLGRNSKSEARNPKQ